jgi:hypothetical protein
MSGSQRRTIGRPRAEEHHFTPAHIEIDALGRTVKAVQRNRALHQKPGDPMPVLEEYTTLSTYDIRGNLLTVTDALAGRLSNIPTT